MAKRRLDNWLLSYRDYASGTESPEIFHLWTALSVIMSAAQRKIYMEHDYFKTHTNMYIVLVGPSGVRKSTAIKLGKKILLDVENYGFKIHLSTNATSTAALIQQFIKLSNEDHQSLTTLSSELGSLIRASDTDIVGFLTDIYDCEPGWDKQTVGRGIEMIEKPWLNVLGATTPDWMTDNLGKLSIEGGFVRRVLFVYHDQHKLIAFPQMTDEQKQLRKDLTHDLAQIAALSGAFDFATPAAKEFFRSWYEDPKRLKLTDDSRLRGYHECKADHAKKVAMALSLSEDNSLKITEVHLDLALKLLAELELGMQKALTSVGKNPFNTDIDRIQLQIHAAGKISYKRLFAMNVHALDRRQFDEVMTTLADIDRAVVKGGVVYSPAKWREEETASAK
jgi:energy-coupling factor transporter ATP-binding protein EcfA2